MKRLAFLLTSAALMTVTAISWSFAQDKVDTQGFSSISSGYNGPGNNGPGNNGPGNNGPGNYSSGNYSPGNLIVTAIGGVVPSSSGTCSGVAAENNT